MVFNVTTLERIKVQGDFSATEVKNDAFFNQLIPSMSERFEQYIEQEILVKSRTVLFDVFSTSFKFLTPVAPIHLVTSVKNDPNHDFTSTTAIASTQYRVKSKKGIIILHEELLSPGFEALEVIYLGGLALKTGDFISQLNDPPVAPAVSATYLVGDAPTGAWVANTTDLATWNGAAWVFKTQQTRFFEIHPSLSLAAEIQINFEYQRRNRLGSNHTALKSHVNTFNKGDFLPQVESILNKFVRRLFTEDE